MNVFTIKDIDSMLAFDAAEVAMKALGEIVDTTDWEVWETDEFRGAEGFFIVNTAADKEAMKRLRAFIEAAVVLHTRVKTVSVTVRAATPQEESQYGVGSSARAGG